MTEKSIFWSGYTVGEAASAPISARHFADFLTFIFGHGGEYKYPPALIPCNNGGGNDLRVNEGVIAGRLNELEVTRAGNVVSMNTGYALISGRWYHNDASVTLADFTGSPTPPAGEVWHVYFGLQAYNAAVNQIVQPNYLILQDDCTPYPTSAYPSYDRDGFYFFPMYYIQFDEFGGFPVERDLRKFLRCNGNQMISARERQGGDSDDFTDGGNTDYDAPLQSGIVVGEHSAGTVVASGTTLFMLAAGQEYPIGIATLQGNDPHPGCYSLYDTLASGENAFGVPWFTFDAGVFNGVVTYSVLSIGDIVDWDDSQLNDQVY